MKKNNLTKKSIILSSIFLIILTSINIISAIGVTAPYWDEHPLELSKGQSANIQFEIQNMASGSSNETFKVEVVRGSEIVSITDPSKEYIVNYGSKVKVNLKVQAPEDAKVGETYDIELSFTTLQKSQSGSFGFGSAIQKSFPIKIIGETTAQPSQPEQQTPSTPTTTPSEEEKQKTNLYILITAIIIIAIAIVIVLLRRKKKKRK